MPMARLLQQLSTEPPEPPLLDEPVDVPELDEESQPVDHYEEDMDEDGGVHELDFD